MSYLEQIKKLEQEKAKIIERRQAEILKIIVDSKTLDFNNKLLATFMKFIGNPANKDHPFLKELAQLSETKAKAPSRSSKELEPA